MKQTEKRTKEDAADYGVLSIPNTMLEAAGIPQVSELTVEAIPGVLMIGIGEPMRTANQPLFDLLAAIGIEPEEVMSALEEGGYFDRQTNL